MTRSLRHLLRSAHAEVLKEMRDEGWTIEPTRGDHFRWLHPSGAILISSATPSDWRAWANHLSRMRRARTRTRIA